MPHAIAEKVPKNIETSGEEKVKKVHIHNKSQRDCFVKKATTEYPFDQENVSIGKTKIGHFTVKSVPPLVDGETYDYEVRPNDIRSITVPCADSTDEYVK